jgi:hypothetical protein
MAVGYQAGALSHLHGGTSGSAGIGPWEPSQKGGERVYLQPQMLLSRTSVSSLNARGRKSVPAWEPSQKGCFLLLPQVQYWYVLPGGEQVVSIPWPIAILVTS